VDDLENIELTGNSCINRNIRVQSREDLIVLNNLLRPCFNNFNGGAQNERQITKKFKGKLKISDEFGNILGRID
jgi:hypothetical protein